MGLLELIDGCFSTVGAACLDKLGGAGFSLPMALPIRFVLSGAIRFPSRGADGVSEVDTYRFPSLDELPTGGVLTELEIVVCSRVI
jgi:hypothetical protein